MRKLAAVLLMLLVAAGSLAAAAAAGGSASDPLISQSYLSGTYIPAVVKEAESRIDAATAKTYDSALTRLKAQADLYLARAGAQSGAGHAPSFAEQRFKLGDVITVDAGSGVMLLSGSAALGYQSGAVVDVTAGSAVLSGTAMGENRRYLAAENTLLRATITSDTAVLALQGYYTLTSSGELDYNQLAAALKTMGLFQGTGTSYGEGFDLERIPTRIEGLVLFLRLIGEEKAALAYNGESPFSDVPEWGRRYVAYAYQKGYTKGIDEEYKIFGGGNTISAGEYLTFLLRALGYRDSGASPDFTWDTAVTRGQTLGVITAGEGRLLTSGRSFSRAQVAYLSYYALAANRRAGGSLQSYLISSGALELGKVNAANAAVTVKRLV